jgi:hypothetical protein
MSMKGILSVVLLLFVAASVGALILEESGLRGEPETNAGSAVESSVPGRRLIVSYIHGDLRCETCLFIEETARETVQSAFAEQLASGRVEWRTANMDASGNEHLVTDYDLTTSSLVLSDVLDGVEQAWWRVDEVWEHSQDMLGLMALVESEIELRLESAE